MHDQKWMDTKVFFTDGKWSILRCLRGEFIDQFCILFDSSFVFFKWKSKSSSALAHNECMHTEKTHTHKPIYNMICIWHVDTLRNERLCNWQLHLVQQYETSLSSVSFGFDELSKKFFVYISSSKFARNELPSSSSSSIDGAIAVDIVGVFVVVVVICIALCRYNVDTNDVHIKRIGFHIKIIMVVIIARSKGKTNSNSTNSAKLPRKISRSRANNSSSM